MGTLKVYAFARVLMQGGENFGKLIIEAVREGSYPKGVSGGKGQAFDLLKAKSLGEEAKEWVDMVFRKKGVSFTKSEAFRAALNYTQDNEGTSIIVSASPFVGVINYMIEKEGLTDFIPPKNVFTVDNNMDLIPSSKAHCIKQAAEDFKHTNIVFLDDDKRNVEEVAKLDGSSTGKGRLFVTAMRVNHNKGIEDSALLERAKAKEIEYNKFGIYSTIGDYNDKESIYATICEEQPIYVDRTNLESDKKNEATTDDLLSKKFNKTSGGLDFANSRVVGEKSNTQRDRVTAVRGTNVEGPSAVSDLSKFTQASVESRKRTPATDAITEVQDSINRKVENSKINRDDRLQPPPLPRRRNHKDKLQRIVPTAPPLSLEVQNWEKGGEELQGIVPTAPPLSLEVQNWENGKELQRIIIPTAPPLSLEVQNLENRREVKPKINPKEELQPPSVASKPTVPKFR
ncbi:hypothetical protein [Flavobacterium poyangense]|uniref:hypothetical protein n=1 Tax=Flavobacterium poyangense TaxID=2204302 RepID=UPI00141D9FB7|nr:hypothetical protein [Flavobacterium sp. JXAS1]